MDKVKNTCSWPGGDKLMQRYHDREWGVPLYEDSKIFEFLVLESMQAGLSWRTILYKRENFKKAFEKFDYKKIAKFNKKDVEKLLKNVGIIRNRLKIEAVINNAKRFMEVQKEFGSFSNYMWKFVDNRPILGKRKTLKSVPSVTVEAENLTRDLKNRGFKFMGATVVYAHMQAVGMVNDHIIDCFRYKELKLPT